MNLLLLPRSALSPNGEVVVSGRQATHMKEVLKAVVGSTIRVGIDNSCLGVGQVISLETTSVRETVDTASAKKKRRNTSNQYQFRVLLPHMCSKAALSTPPAPVDTVLPANVNWERPRIDLLLAMPRPKVFDKVLQTVATLGIGRLFITPTARVEGGYFSSPKLSITGITDALRLGLEQSATDPFFPEVYVYASWKRCLNEIASRFIIRPSSSQHNTDVGHCYSHKLIAFHPDDTAPHICSDLVGVKAHQQGPVLIAIGPEGGFVDSEVQDLRDLKFDICQMGPRIFKVEMALIMALAQITMLLNETPSVMKTSKQRYDLLPADILPCWCQAQQDGASRDTRIVLPVRGRDTRENGNKIQVAKDGPA